jgi:hypothetical protein
LLHERDNALTLAPFLEAFPELPLGDEAALGNRVENQGGKLGVHGLTLSIWVVVVIMGG